VSRTVANIAQMLFCILLRAMIPEQVFAQDSIEIDAPLRAMQSGDQRKAEELAAPLIQRHPDDPAVLYLKAAITPMASTAIQLYQRIWSDAPRSMWADDAVYRLYQYSIAVGAYQAAERYSQRLRTRWPDSPYLSRVVAVPGTTPFSADGDRTQTSGTAGGLTTAVPRRGTTQGMEGMAAAGTSGIVTSQTPRTESPDVPVPSARGKYSVQAGMYPARKDARRRESELSEAGYTVEVLERPSGSTVLFCVLVGHFETVEQARAFRTKLKAQTGIDGKVTAR
jgi:hypothetical protein